MSGGIRAARPLLYTCSENPSTSPLTRGLWATTPSPGTSHLNCGMIFGRDCTNQVCTDYRVSPWAPVSTFPIHPPIECIDVICLQRFLTLPEPKQLCGSVGEASIHYEACSGDHLQGCEALHHRTRRHPCCAPQHPSCFKQGRWSFLYISKWSTDIPALTTTFHSGGCCRLR